MAKGGKTGGRDFQPGNKLGKGRPPIPEDVREIRKISADTVKRLISRYVDMTAAELKVAAESDETPMLEKMIASVIAKALDAGDYTRIDFLLNRLIGKVTEKVEVKLPEPFIVRKRDGEEIVMGAKMPKEENV